jgi:hypothetical protein
VTVSCGSCIDLHDANASLGQWNCFFYGIGPWWAAVGSPVLEPFGDVAARRRAWAEPVLAGRVGVNTARVYSPTQKSISRRAGLPVFR